MRTKKKNNYRYTLVHYNDFAVIQAFMHNFFLDNCYTPITVSNPYLIQDAVLVLSAHASHASRNCCPCSPEAWQKSTNRSSTPGASREFNRTCGWENSAITASIKFSLVLERSSIWITARCPTQSNKMFLRFINEYAILSTRLIGELIKHSVESKILQLFGFWCFEFIVSELMT